MTILTIDVGATKASIDNEEAILIDVREDNEYSDYHIEKSQLAQLSNLPNAIQKVDIPKDKKIILYCLKGGRSAQAIEFLQENYLKGYELYNMEDGITAWVEAGLPVIRAD